jgi:hypothetical protein
MGSDNTMQTALVIILLLAILAGAVFVGHYGWVSAGDVTMPAWGWMMMGLGIFFTLLVGGGLMALVFYSSRAGFDEPPEVVQEKETSSSKVDEDDTEAQKTALVLGRVLLKPLNEAIHGTSGASAFDIRACRPKCLD